MVQQQGRAGRAGNQAHHLLIYNNRQVRNLDPDMVTYVRNENNVCRRQLLLSHYSACRDEERILHICCDICTADCKCGSPECSELNHIAHNSEGDVESDSETEPKSCGTGSHVTEQQKQALNMSLEQYRMQLNEEFKAGSVTAAPEVTHGFTASVIDSVVRRCASLQSADDVMALCGFWSYEQAKAVHLIVSSILEMESGDTESDTEYTGVDD